MEKYFVSPENCGFCIINNAYDFDNGGHYYERALDETFTTEAEAQAVANEMNDLAYGRKFKCKECSETLNHADEMVFFLGEDIVYVTEQEPCWDSCMCSTCADEKGLM